MATCPNKNLDSWKALVEEKGETLAYYLWDKYNGDVPTSPEKLNEKINSFLKDINVKVELVDKLHDDKGNLISAVAKSVMLDKVIQVMNGKEDITTLPEEAAHFFVAMLGDNDLYKEMYKNITQYKIYQETVAEYRNNSLYRTGDGVIDFDKIKKEAMGKLIMAHIIKQETGEEVSDKINTIKTWWGKVLDYLKKIFFDVQNPFQKAGEQILSGDTSLLSDIKDTDGVFLQTVNQSVFVGIDQMIKDQERIKLDDSIDPATGEKKHLYTVDGSPIIDKDGNSRSVNSVVVNAWYKDRFPVDNRSVRQTQIDNLKAEEGTKLHADMQNIIERYFNKDGTRKAEPSVKNGFETNAVVYDALETYFLQLLQQYQDPNIRMFSELRIYDAKRNIAGTIDLVVVHADNSVDIYDWKSQEVGKNQDDLKWFKTPAYRIQLGEYKKILSQEYGFTKFNKIRAIPMKTTFFYTKTADGLAPKALKNVEIGNANATLIPENKNFLLPVVMHNESTGNKNLDELVGKLNAILEILQDQKVKPSEKDIKAEELNMLSKVIRDLQVRQSMNSFIENGMYEIQKFNDMRYKNKFDINNIRDAINTMKVYASASEFLGKQAVELKQQISRLEAVGNSDPDELADLKQLREKFVEMQLNSGHVLNRLIEIREKLGDQLATENGISTLLKAEKSMDWLKRNFRSVSTLDTAAMKTFYTILRKAQTIREQKIHEMFHTMTTLQKNLLEWNKGKKGVDVFDYILQKDEKGNWNGDFLNIYDRKYFEEKKEAIKNSDIKWFKENTVFNETEYNEGYNAQKEMLEERYPGDSQKDRRDALLLKWEEKHHEGYEYAHINKYNQYIKPNEKWYSEKYKFMLEKGNEPLKAVYDYFQDMIKYSASLGMIDKFSSKFIPSVVAGNDLNLSKMMDSMTVNSDGGFGKIDLLTGLLKKEIPVYFTRDLGKKKEDGSIDYSEKSQDLFRVFGQWGAQMYNYEAMSSLEDMSDVLLEIEKEKRSLATNSYGKTDRTKETKNNSTNAQVLENYINYYIYGQAVGGKFDRAFKINGKEYSSVKVAQKLMKFMSLKTLGLNFLSGTSTFVGGTGNAFLQSAKKTVFTQKEWIQGVKDYSGKDKVTIAAIYKLGLSVENHNNEEIRKLSVSGAMDKLSTDHLMYLQHVGDKWGTFPVAATMLHTYMIDDGKVVNIRDYVKKQNNYDGIYNLSSQKRNELLKKIDGEVEEMQKVRSLKATGKIENDQVVIPGLTDNIDNITVFRGVVQKTLKNIIGNATRDDLNQVRMSLLGSALMQFRSWMPQMITERMGDMSYDVDAETWNYGKTRLFFKHVINKQILSLTKELITGFGDNTINMAKKRYGEFIRRLTEDGKISDPSEFMTEAQFIDMYLGNLRSMMKELMLVLAFGSFIFAPRLIGDDDDKTGVRQFMTKALKKYFNEFAFYYSPSEFNQLVGVNHSPVAVMGLLLDLENFGTHIVEKGFGYATDDQSLIDSSHPLKYLFKILPITKELQQDYAIFDDDFRKSWNIQ